MRISSGSWVWQQVRGPSRSVRRAVAATVMLVAIMISVSACGSGSGSTSVGTEGGSTGVTSADAPSGAAIKVGSICACTGPQSAGVASPAKSVEVWAEYVNANGGINGHPVELILKDDHEDAAKSLQAAKELIEEEHVVAIVSDYTGQDGAWQKYVEEKDVPVIGGLTLEGSFVTSPDFFAQGMTLPVAQLIIGGMLKKLHKESFRIWYCAQSPVCALAGKLASAAAAASGAPTEVTGAPVDITAPNFTAPCLQAEEDDVDAVELAVNPAPAARIMESCLQQGFEPQVFGVGGSFGPKQLGEPAFDGTVMVSTTRLPSDTSNPAVKRYVDALETYAPGFIESSSYSNAGIEAWAAGELFTAAAKAVKLTPSSTPEDVKRGLYALKGQTLEGLTAPLPFEKGKPGISPCAFVNRIEDGEFVEENGGEPVCATAAEMGALFGELEKILG